MYNLAVFLRKDRSELSLVWGLSLIGIAIFIVVLSIGLLLIFLFCLRSKGKCSLYLCSLQVVVIMLLVMQQEAIK